MKIWHLPNRWPVLKVWICFSFYSVAESQGSPLNMKLLSQKFVCWPCLLAHNMDPAWISPPPPLLSSPPAGFNGCWAVFTHSAVDTKYMVSCPTLLLQLCVLQFNSAPTLLGVSVGSNELRAQPLQTAPTSDVSCKYSGTFDQLATNSGGFHSPLLRFDNSLEQLMELRRALYSWLSLCHKGFLSETVSWKRCTG